MNRAEIAEGKKIYSERPEIEKAAMEKYPLSKDELNGCATAKMWRNRMRFEFAKKIYYERKNEQE